MTKKTEKKLFNPKKMPEYIREIITPAGTHMLKIEIRKDGQSFRKSIKVSDFDTPSQALEFAKQLKNEVLVNIQQKKKVSGYPTVGELYEKTFELFPVRMATRKRHDAFYNNGISQYADVTIDKIKSEVRESINEYARNHTRTQTTHFKAVWHRIYMVCAEKDINVIDRTATIKLPECYEGIPRKTTVTPEDLETFCDFLLRYNMASVTGSYYCRAVYYGIRIMQYTGMRPAEAFALTKDDIHLLEGYISVNKAVHSTADSMVDIGKTKTQKSRRDIPVPPNLKPYLAECLAWSRHDFILADYNGNFLDISEVCTLVGNVRKKVGVDFRLYQLRHMFSTDLFSGGTAPNVVRDLMGHTSSTMSLDYAASSETDRKQAINERKFS